MRMILIYVLMIASVSISAQQAPATQIHKRVQSIVSALDYVSIDYPEAVKDGLIIDPDEYAEQLDFLTTVQGLLQALPGTQNRVFLEQARVLEERLKARVSGSEISRLSRALTADLLATYQLEVTPRIIPNPANAAPLFAENCAACHGALGHGDGPAASELNPPPTNFHDIERARQRSLYGLFSAISQGIAGTGMTSFQSLSDDDRWALAYYIAGLRDEPAVIAKGEYLWKQGILRGQLSMADFTSRTPAEMSQQDEAIEAVLAFLRHQPQALEPARTDAIGYTQQGLQASLEAYRNGDPESAMQLALDAYLEGYELTEGSLRALDSKLAMGIERDMQVLRGQIRDRVSYAAQQEATSGLQKQLDQAARLLSDKGGSAITVFVSALLILLREGLEAILVISAMGLYLRRTEQTQSLRYLHFGWLGALVAGAFTWLAIKTVIVISGAQREVLEGTGALLAAFVLLYVGIWMHRHGSAARWQSFLNKRLGNSLSAGALWGVAGLSFIAVYREILETVLFYETLWLQSGLLLPLVAGAAVAVAALLGLGWLVFRIGTRLPLRQFFQFNGMLMFVLAIVFCGKGVSALQEAGLVNVTFIGLPRVDWLGLYPTMQSAGAQFFILIAGAIWLLPGLFQARTN